jgi:chemotaxis protein methyltransferase WspC
VPETWFFRNREAFDALTHFVREHQTHTQSGPMRLLSLPCSTGEEPYSIAMALLDAGIPPSRFRVTAVDVSERAIAQARRGEYRNISFRGDRLDFRDRYFQPTGHGQSVGAAVRQQVDFRCDNLLHLRSGGVEQFDVIFCRNVLIYFDSATQGRVAASLSRMLSPTGILFVGSSETGLFPKPSFVPVKAPMAFAFRKAGVAATAEVRATHQRSAPPRSTTTRHDPGVMANTEGRRTHQKVDPPVQQVASRGEDLSKTTLQTAARLADDGRFAEALQMCEEQRRLHGPSAAGFHLQGLIHDARGHHVEAAANYRRAVYLDPFHHEALTHLALVMEKWERKAEAQLLRARARRAANTSNGC